MIAVPPKQLYLSVAGVVIKGEIKILKDEEVNITCHALGALPAVNLSWRIDGKLANFSTTYTALENGEGSFDAISMLLFRPEPGHKEIECVSKLNASDEEQVVFGKFLFYVPPKQLYLSVAGVVIKGEIKILKDEEVNITCHALGALPAVNLSWRIDGKLANFSTTYTARENGEGTFDAISMLLFRPEPGHKEIECVSKLNASDEEQVVFGKLLFNDKSLLWYFQNIPISWGAVSSGVAGLLIILNCIYCLKRNFKGSPKSNSRTHSDDSLASFAPGNLTTAGDTLEERENQAEPNRPGLLQLRLSRTEPVSEVYENTDCDTDVEKSSLSEILAGSDQPDYANYNTKPKKLKFPRISAIPVPPERNEYETDMSRLNSSMTPATTELGDSAYEDLEY